MKRFLAAVIVILCTVTSSYAGDVYGCIINETPASYFGVITSDAYKLDFDVHGDYIWCSRLPEGRYTIRSSDGKLDHDFTASWQNSIGLVGDETLHWLVKIKEQDIEK
ncbi:hypothetical protein [Maridesulfovibrio sp. FT414]|uniref:hypothetical protein n=1 Tax=Maridesulfovibrio sp. FT414 TaxID=2979469 RepID=UPI003D8016E9